LALFALKEYSHNRWCAGNPQFEIRNPKFMLQPEISPRCSSCGAAVREPAMFCPECGKALTKAAAETETASAEAEAASSIDSQPVAASSEKIIGPADESTGAAADAAMTAKKADKTDESDAPHGARERTRERLQRASTAARGALEDNVKRVEKIHHVSTAMIEEAHYDPSLRFVLVALGLFIVFVVLLVLSKVMG
jgi:predicted  nucleic acid-binding Zn-ribbon protein